MPRSSSENDRLKPAHHSAEGVRSMGRQTSSVTAPGFVCPVISGIRSGEQTSAIPFVPLSHNLQVMHRRPHAQLFENAILSLVARHARYPAVRIVEVAKDNRAGGAGLLAGGANVAVLDRGAQALG